MLYEDDYEFEEQPANIRDRQIPGKTTGERTTGTGTGGGRRGGGGGRHAADGGGGAAADWRRRWPSRGAPSRALR